MSSAVELAAAVPAAAPAPPPSMTVLAPVARPPVARLLVVSDLPCSRFSGLIRSRRPTPVALHAPREIDVRAVGALPVAVPDARGRRAGPPAPVRRLRLGLRRGLLDEDRVPREVRRFPHACRPITRGPPVGHFALLCVGLCCHAWASAAASNGWSAAIGRPLTPGRRLRCDCRPLLLRFASPLRHYLAACNILASFFFLRDAIAASPSRKVRDVNPRPLRAPPRRPPTRGAPSPVPRPRRGRRPPS